MGSARWRSSSCCRCSRNGQCSPASLALPATAYRAPVLNAVIAWGPPFVRHALAESTAVRTTRGPRCMQHDLRQHGLFRGTTAIAVRARNSGGPGPRRRRRGGWPLQMANASAATDPGRQKAGEIIPAWVPLTGSSRVGNTSVPEDGSRGRRELSPAGKMPGHSPAASAHVQGAVRRSSQYWRGSCLRTLRCATSLRGSDGWSRPIGSNLTSVRRANIRPPSKHGASTAVQRSRPIWKWIIAVPKKDPGRAGTGSGVPLER